MKVEHGINLGRSELNMIKRVCGLTSKDRRMNSSVNCSLGIRTSQFGQDG